MKQLRYSIRLLSCIVLSIACSSGGDTSGPQRHQLSGKLLYDFGEHIYQVDLATNSKTIYFDHNNYSLNGWDVSQDGKIRLETEQIAGATDKVKFRLINTNDNSLIKEFEYKLVNGEDRNIAGLLSPDRSRILIQPDFDHGIVIIDTDGNVMHHLPRVNDEELTLGDKVRWLPGNGILFTFQDKYVLRSDPPYTSITPVKEMAYNEWGGLNVSRDGSKISLRIDKHIYLMNSDGSDLVQVTESDRAEREAVFSPDGKNLLVAADYYPATFDEGKWILNVIPANGQTYKVGNDPSQDVIPIIAEGQNNAEPASGTMLWR
ncbi:TolB family protein [Parapedobacter tibetensis]|uniref:TolB family protein n=1 Tax=Parapedobacter tibetensis TaxID=2972951 RepID=UPI00214D30E4|nr:hypothetical protein [Parapedobacter tibetensis]